MNHPSENDTRQRRGCRQCDAALDGEQRHPQRRMVLAATLLLPASEATAQVREAPYPSAAQGGNYMRNFYFPPAPSAKRCFDFGAALGRLINASSNAGRVVLIASGGLSHTKIDEKLDQDFMAALAAQDAEYLSGMADEILTTGTSEIRNWISVAGAAGFGGTMVDYVPCYRNADGVGCAMGFAYWDQKSA